ncbi:hypothetical protein NDU88_006970 [Pleurodeles waltl]|uniref:Uncharacterized protein n=1 Tax=Pleurodeles waltl TaxID=8319 RepID=A0AAV7LR69_PLEWA|nr:hypothetical protein NDU88_006970 [Pleurodeles waltl]
MNGLTSHHPEEGAIVATTGIPICLQMTTFLLDRGPGLWLTLQSISPGRRRSVYSSDDCSFERATDNTTQGSRERSLVHRSPKANYSVPLTSAHRPLSGTTRDRRTRRRK